MKKTLTLLTLLLISSLMTFAQVTIKPSIKPSIKPTITPTIKPSIKPAIKPSYTLTVSSNVMPYSLFINGERVYGNSDTLVTGNYEVLIQAEGYNDYLTEVMLTQNIVLNANLIKKMAYVKVNIPNYMLNNSVSNPKNRIKIYDNGQVMNGLDFELNPGEHTIRIEAGGFAIENTYTFENGRNYKISPGLFMNIE